MSCRGKLAKLDEKLTLMEQKVEYIEGRVCNNLYMLLPIYNTANNLMYFVFYR